MLKLLCPFSLYAISLLRAALTMCRRLNIFVFPEWMSAYYVLHSALATENTHMINAFCS